MPEFRVETGLVLGFKTQSLSEKVLESLGTTGLKASRRWKALCCLVLGFGVWFSVQGLGLFHHPHLSSRISDEPG